jgi:hypothetical protein
MLNTQITMANETIKELQQKIQVLEHEASQPKPSGTYVGLDGGMSFETSDEYAVAEE